jgi:hypothetical protein
VKHLGAHAPVCIDTPPETGATLKERMAQIKGPTRGAQRVAATEFILTTTDVLFRRDASVARILHFISLGIEIKI